MIDWSGGRGSVGTTPADFFQQEDMTHGSIQVFDFAAEAFSGPAAESEGGGGDAGIQEAAAAAATPGGRGRDKGAPRGGAVLCKLLKGQDEQAFLAHVRARWVD